MLIRNVAGLAVSALYAQAAVADAAPGVATSGVSMGSVVQMLFGLVVVLAMVGVAAWLLKRFLTIRGSDAGPIRVISSAAVGQRERVVLVEVGETWLLIGVAPGQVRTLHTMARANSATALGGASPVLTGAPFASLLRRFMPGRTDG